MRFCRTTLNSEIVSRFRNELPTMSIDAVLSVTDLERRDVNLHRTKIVGKVGSRIEDTRLLHGLLIDKTRSHSQVPRVVDDARVAILTRPFESPKSKQSPRWRPRRASNTTRGTGASSATSRTTSIGCGPRGRLQ
jgi:T-complex protein 1 subunit epsilon